MSDFGKIYDEWERLVSDRGKPKPEQNKAGSGKKLGPGGKETTDARTPREGKAAAPSAKPDAGRQFSDWLDRHLVEDKDEGSETRVERRTKRELEALAIDATLDLHGMTARDAEDALERFFLEAARQGYAKVLVVHGKGRHSEAEAVLPGVVRKFLERSPYAGRSFHADRASGGKGAVCVLVRPLISRGR